MRTMESGFLTAGALAKAVSRTVAIAAVVLSVISPGVVSAQQSKPLPTNSTPPTLEQDLAAIAEFNRKYLQAINDEDIATLSSLTTEDHIMIASGRAPLVGKAANDAANAGVFKRFDIVETWTPVETVVAGDWAYQRGTFTVAATPRAGGNTTKTSGNFLRIYKRFPDVGWRMIRDMFNSEQQPAQK